MMGSSDELIARLEKSCPGDAAEVSFARDVLRLVAINKKYKAEIDRLRALNAELDHACGVAHGAILMYGVKVKEFDCEPWLDVERLASLLRAARLKVKAAGLVTKPCQPPAPTDETA